MLSAQRLVRIGRDILALLKVDPRLAEAAAVMQTVQAALEAKFEAWTAAVDARRDRRADRTAAQRELASAIREFGFVILNLTGNHHGVDPYLRYFPSGYGDATHLNPAELIEFARLVLARLAEEPNPRIAGCRTALEAGLNAFVAAEEACEAAERTHNQAAAMLKAEKRNWGRGVAQAKALAEAACHFDRRYVRTVFGPALGHRRSETAEEPETEGTNGGAPAAAIGGSPATGSPAPTPSPPQEAHS